MEGQGTRLSLSGGRLRLDLGCLKLREGGGAQGLNLCGEHLGEAQRAHYLLEAKGHGILKNEKRVHQKVIPFYIGEFVFILIYSAKDSQSDLKFSSFGAKKI